MHLSRGKGAAGCVGRMAAYAKEHSHRCSSLHQDLLGEQEASQRDMRRKLGKLIINHHYCHQFHSYF